MLIRFLDSVRDTDLTKKALFVIISITRDYTQAVYINGLFGRYKPGPSSAAPRRGL